MPYKTPPARIRNLIPAEHGQRLWTNVVNSQLKSGKSESVAMASAWAALKEDGYVKTDGKWVKKAEETYRAPAGAALLRTVRSAGKRNTAIRSTAERKSAGRAQANWRTTRT